LLQLIVGSDDFDIRVFKNDAIIEETSETDAIVCLYHIEGQRFAYALANGTLGVYDGMQRVWRIKSKNTVIAMNLFDINGDGERELVVGWATGKVDFRTASTGEVLIKESLTAGIAGVAVADYRLDGRQQLICVSVDGESECVRRVRAL
jgi:Bardet-Biedl syndrome 2 protein